MEQVQHCHHQPRKKATAKTNVTISVVIHVLLFAGGAYWAAREGVLGSKLKELSVRMVPKEKKPEEPKKQEETLKKAEEVKREIQTAKSTVPAQKLNLPAVVNAPAAPPPVAGGFTIGPGDLGDVGAGNGDAIGHYKQQVETALRLVWERPENIQDMSYVAEVEMRVDAKGKIAGYDWKKGSGNQRWDDSVKKAIASTKNISSAPPKGFPDKFTVKFDVTSSTTEPLVSRAD
jgi:hypothetical protein